MILAQIVPASSILVAPMACKPSSTSIGNRWFKGGAVSEGIVE